MECISTKYEHKETRVHAKTEENNSLNEILANVLERVGFKQKKLGEITLFLFKQLLFGTIVE